MVRPFVHQTEHQISRDWMQSYRYCETGDMSDGKLHSLPIRLYNTKTAGAGCSLSFGKTGSLRGLFLEGWVASILPCLLFLFFFLQDFSQFTHYLIFF